MDGRPGISESQGLKINLLSASHVSCVASHLRAWENLLGCWRDLQAKELESCEEIHQSKGDDRAAALSVERLRVSQMGSPVETGEWLQCLLPGPPQHLRDQRTVFSLYPVPPSSRSHSKLSGDVAKATFPCTLG